ncbi:hypothetical protein QCN28_16640 [Bordetella bronchiseptica]|uniref:hypothetical protein n=1 Tax=Bordetella bronchiseptica TaxID=518 RepID=UPI003F749D6B
MKKSTASMPQGLAGANAAYCQRMAELAQESQQRWIELGQRLTDDGAARYLSTLPPLKQSGSWQDIALALGEATRMQWQCQLEAGQALTHALLEEQAAPAGGVSEAMTGWLKQGAGGGIGLDATPMAQIWKNVANQTAAACSALSDACTPGTRRYD